MEKKPDTKSFDSIDFLISYYVKAIEHESKIIAKHQCKIDVFVSEIEKLKDEKCILEELRKDENKTK